MKNGKNWSLIYTDYVPEQEKLREALCTLGNGYFATRGAFPEVDADEFHYPGTYLAGGYNRLSTEVAGKVIVNEGLVNIPNWLSLKFRINGGDWFLLRAIKILSFRQEIDLHDGVLKREIRFQDAHGKTTNMQEERFVHMKHFHIAAIKRTITAENWSGKIEIQSALDGKIKNVGIPRYRKFNSNHLEPLEQGVNEDKNLFLKVQTTQSLISIALAAKNNFFLDGQLIPVDGKAIIEDGFVALRYTFDLKEGSSLAHEKYVSLYTSRDKAISECLLQAKNTVSRDLNYEKLLQSHKKAWKSLWGQFDIEIETTSEPKNNTKQLLILRMHIFHLLQTVSSNSIEIDVGVPSRGWHGEAYRGHIFWDELFIFPILNLRMPKVTLALLKYRYRRLKEALHAAKIAGYNGAMYPWQSGSSGREETQKVHLNPISNHWLPDNSYIQRHVNLAIAYNICRYFEVTDDMDFLRSYGLEMLLEIVRFLASICTFDVKSDRYEILGVMGPDEYHDAYPKADKPGLNNNAYTNLLCAWVLDRALNLLKILPEDHHREIIDMLEIEDEELIHWEEISKKIKIPFHDDQIISQFEGYEKLKEFDWEGYQKKYKDIQRLDRILEAEGDSPNNYKVSKQADLLMIFYLLSNEELQKLFNQLGYEYSEDLAKKNINYYLKRTCHGSTLSRIVHSWVLSRIDKKASWGLFCNALESDVADIQGGTTQEGIHLGAMAGTVDLVQRCFSGIVPQGDTLSFDPFLPEDLQCLCFHLHYRGHSIEVEITQSTLKITSKYSIARKIWIGFKGQKYKLSAGEKHEFKL